jgi:hypothetical protein
VLLFTYFLFFIYFFTFFNTNQHQNILTFFTFYITSIIFHYYSNKKISLQYKIFSLFYTNSFYFISHHHFLLISKLTTHYSVLFCNVTCQTSPICCLSWYGMSKRNENGKLHFPSLIIIIFIMTLPIF